MQPASRVVIALVVLAVAAGAFLWWRRPHPSTPVEVGGSRPVAAPPVLAPVPARVAAPPVKAPGPVHPLAPPATARGPLPGLDDSDGYFEKRLDGLAGGRATRSVFSLAGFVRRVVATVSNLATDNAAADLWPVKPAPGRFETITAGSGEGGAALVSPRNAERYADFVRFASHVDAERVVALYVRTYPLLQRAYEELGYPDQALNDRVIQTIDHLLATPTVAEPIAVRRVDVAGVNPARPGGLFVFADPALEARSSGQKILLRMGHENADRLMVKLRELRQRLVAAEVSPTTPRTTP